MEFKQQAESKDLSYYCKRFAELNPSRNKIKDSGNAPYKPILLLSVIDLIQQGVIQENNITVSEELINTFNQYWKILASDSSYAGGLHYPFIHLESEGFWIVEFNPEFRKGRKIGTTKALKDAVKYARLDSELFSYIKDPLLVQRLIDSLIESWFSSSRSQIEDILQINQDFQDITQTEIHEIETDQDHKETPRSILKKTLVRNAFFRKAVVHSYDYRCAFCHLKVINSLNQSIVDGAHIKPFSRFFDNRVNNGLSLCKNHHWAFDQGWFTVDENYRIIVTNDLTEESPHSKPIKDFHGKSIVLPRAEQYFPRPDALRWHQLNIFQGTIRS